MTDTRAAPPSTAPAEAAPARGAASKRPRAGLSLSPGRRVVVATMVWLGVLVLLYPSAAQWFEQRAQSIATRELSSTVEKVGPTLRHQLLDAARGYNQRFALGSGLPGDDYRDTLLLPSADVIARLRVPAIDLDQPIRHTLDESALVRGVGHSENSSLPIGGVGTHAVLGAHRGVAESVGFTHLPEVKKGDLIHIEVMDEVLTYRVTSTEVLEPQQAALHPVYADRDIISLITCTPLGVNSHRFVVTADRLEPPPVQQTAGQASMLPRFPYWALGVAAATIGLAAVIVHARREHKRERLAAFEEGLARMCESAPAAPTAAAGPSVDPTAETERIR
ncbi:class C sortase [Leucobacter muris]|uniref:Class C sortase n=1 Tax=Leucobacter muris TaxID=1935379 RepID=A0ABX5QFQ3_9MICO|nr:class C sortase [Leucobacter muris]QAB17870.1 class C sortase [Leucobacter muris]